MESIDYSRISRSGLAKQIAEELRSAIVEGRLLVNERLPSEHELAERFGVSRPTIREALKRLAAQNLIRSRRGPAGGTFVNRMSHSEAREAAVTAATLLVSMGSVALVDVVEARHVMERACLPLAVANRSNEDIALLEEALAEQKDPDLSDEAFCAADVRFHRTLVDACGNPMLSFQMAGLVEAMQPVLNMIVYQVRDRAFVIEAHGEILAAVRTGNANAACTALDRVTDYIGDLARKTQDKRIAKPE